MTHWVMDIETLSNLFIACFEHYKKDEKRAFVVWKNRNDLAELLEFLEENKTGKQWHLSYNGLSFDSQVIQWIMNNCRGLLQLDGEDAAVSIYAYAQSIINKQEQGGFADFPEWKLDIKQIDVFKMNHWDSAAKTSSLKWIQYAMDWKNMEEMPIHHSTWITTEEQVQTILEYCFNDVSSTKAIVELSSEQIMLRKSLTEEYGINLYSASEPRISKELFAHFLAPKLGIDKRELKTMRTHRDKVLGSEVILPNINFKTPQFGAVLNWFKNLEIDFNSKDKYQYSMRYKGVQTDYGLGGIHGARTPGIYTAGGDFIIMTSDVTSFYPNLSIKNGFAPAHLPKKEFLELYEWFFEERKKIPKSNPKNYVYKIILNATYGLSKEKNSFLYDPKFTMQITINGQLQLSMLYEMLAEGIPGSIPLMQNTDGLEMMIPAQYKDRYMEICAEWERITMLSLEHDQYSKMIIADVNNYIAIHTNGKVKCKGRFEWEDLEKRKVAVLHKNKSFLVIPKAIYNYFVNDISPEDYLESNKNIFDYCAGVKGKGGWQFEARSITEGEYKTQELQKIVRYYVSTNGVKLIKQNKYDGRQIQVEAGKWKQTVCNKIEVDAFAEFEKLNIDKSYYLDAIYKEINNIDQRVTRGFTQLQLF